jgi:aspartate-semialdehyde dehydrogenase
MSAPSSSVAPPAERILVGVAGCTGVVGQRFLSMLAEHPWFRLAAISASDKSAGKRYDEAAAWKLTTDLPADIAAMAVLPNTVESFLAAKCVVVFSALDTGVATQFELDLAAAGIKVFSNASSHRMDARVPILIPHANAEHIAILPAQQRAMGYEEKGGYIVTNANCSSTGLVVALRPLQDAFGIDSLFVTTLQAISGAGYPGVPSLDITDNTIPYISGEEDKMEMEPQKILGRVGKVEGEKEERFIPAGFKVSAQCNRVHVIDGHQECVSIKLKQKATLEQVQACLRDWQSEAQLLRLPSAPVHPIHLHTAANRPQPRLDRDRERGFVVTVGRVRECPLFDWKFTLCSHNTVLGAAGGSILNAELAYAKGYITQTKK